MGISTLTSEVRNIMGTIMKIDQVSRPAAGALFLDMRHTCAEFTLLVSHVRVRLSTGCHR